MSDIVTILFGPKTTDPWFRSTKKQSPHPPIGARDISEPLLVARSVATTPPTTSLPSTRAGRSRPIPSIGASPSALHHRSNKSSAVGPSKTHLRTGPSGGGEFGTSPPVPNSSNSRPSSLIDPSSQSRTRANNGVPPVVDCNGSPTPGVPTSTLSSSIGSLNSTKHMRRKPPTTLIPPVPSLPSGSLPSQCTITPNATSDCEATRNRSTSITSEVVDAKVTTSDTTACVPLPGRPERRPSLGRKPPPPHASMPILSSPLPSPQSTGSFPRTASSVATPSSSFTYEYKNMPNLSTDKVDCTLPGNMGRKGSRRTPTRTPNVAPTVTPIAFPLPPTHQIPPPPAKVVQGARQVARGPAESSQRFHEPPIVKSPSPSTANTPAAHVPIDLLASAPLPPLPSTSTSMALRRSQSLLSLQQRPVAPSRTISHRLKRPSKSRTAAPLYQSFLPSFDDMEEPHSNTVPPLSSRRSA